MSIAIIAAGAVVGSIALLGRTADVPPSTLFATTVTPPIARAAPPLPGHEVYGFVPYWEIDDTIAAHLRSTERGLAGAGFWALGYERGLTDYADLIAAFRAGRSMAGARPADVAWAGIARP